MFLISISYFFFYLHFFSFYKEMHVHDILVFVCLHVTFRETCHFAAKENL
jgi:hypothetical protein